MELPLPVAICDEQGLLEVVNTAFEQQTGFSSGALASRSMDRLFPPHQPDAATTAVWTQLRSQDRWQGARPLRRADGMLWPARATVQRLKPRQGMSHGLAVWVFCPTGD
jgi:PAS domain S-box-containing protein